MSGKYKYQVGSKVKAFGMIGKIVAIEAHEQPLVVQFVDPETLEVYVNWFTLDGKYYTWHKEPSLELLDV